jgi:hypothetical protein
VHAIDVVALAEIELVVVVAVVVAVVRYFATWTNDFATGSASAQSLPTIAHGFCARYGPRR